MDTTYDLFMRIFENGTLGLKRAELIADAYGQVLEIGSGTGVNLTYYDTEKISQITLTDKVVHPILYKRTEKTVLSADLVQMDVEAIPFENEQFDTIETVPNFV